MKELFKRIMARIRGNDGGFTGRVTNTHSCIGCQSAALSMKVLDSCTCPKCGSHLIKTGRIEQ